MSRRTRAVTAARKLLQRYYAEQTNSEATTYTVGDRSFVITGPDDIYILRLAPEWKPKDMELEQEGDV